MKHAETVLSEQPITVLHVDDRESMTSVTADYLERNGESVNVRTANSVSTALAILEEERIDCIVSDYDMPDCNGIDFLRTVRQRDEELPFILFTGKGSEQIASEAISAGVTDYLQKESGSQQYEVLSNRIANAVGRVRATSHLELLIENLPGIVYQHLDEPSWPLVLITGDCEELLGYTARELQEDVHFADEAIHPDDLEYHNNTLRDELQAHGEYELIYRVIRKDGDTRWVIDSELFSGVLIDITELKRDDGGFRRLE
jgi:PAS domain S-box-containing protein